MVFFFCIMQKLHVKVQVKTNFAESVEYFSNLLMKLIVANT